MRAVFDVASIRSAEARLMAQVPDGELMRRAAYGLAVRAAGVLSPRGVFGSQVAALVGPGDNGADALHAGALLARRGAQVTAVQVAASVHEGGARALRQAGGRLLSSATADADAVLSSAALVLDGIAGLGGRPGLQGRTAALVATAQRGTAVVVAVDVPSGVDPTTGAAGAGAVAADLTVTFGALKPGLLVGEGAIRAGLVDLVDIGLAPHLGESAAYVLDGVDVGAALPVPEPTSDKYSLGVAGVCAGSATYPGAALLASAGAVRARSGLVRYSGPCVDAVVTAWPNVIVHRGFPAEAGRVQAWAVGPGLGLDDGAQRRLADVLAAQVPVVVDADALTLLARQGLPVRRPQVTVLTPHAGELVRLAPDLEPHSDPLNAARVLAARARATVLLKGNRSVIAAPDGQVYVNLTGTPWLAEAGTGDVLSGIVAAYLASGLEPTLAAAVAAFVHGLAGRAAADGAPTTPMAVADALPDVLRRLLPDRSEAKLRW